MRAEEFKLENFDINEIMKIEDFSEFMEKLSDEEKIDDFRKPYYGLSNMCQRNGIKVECDGIIYNNTEIPYQIHRCKFDKDKEEFRHSTNPYVVKCIAHSKVHRDDWWDIKIDVMEGLLRQKFQDARLKRELLGTGNKILIEGNTWHDNFWGACKCEQCKDKVKRSNLGKLLMKLRDEFRKEEQQKNL